MFFCIGKHLHYLLKFWLCLRLSLILGKSPKFSKFLALLFAVGPSSLYHVMFYSETLFLFIYLVSVVYLFDWMITKKQKVSDLPILSFLVLSIFFGQGGWVRSTGFFSAAHVCYPILLEVIEDLFSDYKFNLSNLNKAAIKVVKIIVASVIFLFPMFYLQYNVYSLYCISPAGDLPSFCNNKIPNYYDYIQKEFWKVELFSFAKRGHYEELFFILFSLPVWLYIVLKHVISNGILNCITGNIPRSLT